MSAAKDYANAFFELFRGNTNVRGVHIPGKPTPEGKKTEGKSFMKAGTVTLEYYIKHLYGVESMGVVPIDQSNNVRFAAIDIDVYPLDPKKYLDIISRAKLPFVAFRSKSGGLHLICFFVQDSKAEKVIELMQKVRILLALPPDTEIFPKQAKLTKGGKGNFLNLPYFNHSETDRYAYSLSGKPLKIQEAVDLCFSVRTTIPALEQALEKMPLADAPPCLQSLFIRGGPEKGHRNTFLFNCATYLKAVYSSDFAPKLHELNQKLSNPLNYERLDKTVIASHNKGEYSYQCSEGLLVSCCDKTSCALREYGKGSGNVSNLSFERLVQVVSAEPYYKWFINGMELTFYSESELLNQSRFRELCLRFLHHVPDRMKEPAWNAIINRALSNLEVESIDSEDDMSTGSMWMTKVSEFFSFRKALRPSMIEDGMVWLDEKGVLFFKGSHLLEYLHKTGLFRTYKNTQHLQQLRALGAVNGGRLRYPDLKKNVRVWKIQRSKLVEKGLIVGVNGKDKNSENKPITYEPLNFLENEKF